MGTLIRLRVPRRSRAGAAIVAAYAEGEELAHAEMRLLRAAAATALVIIGLLHLLAMS